MSYRAKRVVVTGGAGAIGCNLVRRLSEEGAEVVVLDDLSSGHADNLSNIEGVELVEGSVTEDAAQEKAFSGGAEVVFHLAALFANQNSVDHPQKDLMVDGMGTLKTLEQAVKVKAKRFVYSSSSCVYGSKNYLLQEEDPHFSLDTPYSITKLLGERYVEFFQEHYGLEGVTLRYFNAYGPGEYPGKYRNVIPNFMQIALQGKPLPITGTGEESRDFTYVADTIEGTYRAGLRKEGVGEILNIGSGKETRIKDLALLINEITGNNAGLDFRPKRKWDSVTRRVASIDKAGALLGYTPKHSLREGVGHTYQWFREKGIQ